MIETEKRIRKTAGTCSLSGCKEKEEAVMSIMGIVYYDKFTHDHRLPEWARSERYDYCDGFYEENRRGGLLHSVAAALLSVF